MTTLEFTTTAAGKRIATFTAGDTNTLQYHITAKDADPDRVANVTISARISADFPWAPVKLLVATPADVISRLDVPSGVTVQVECDADISAGVLIG